ncbi:MAG: TNT domain-containing protein [Lachnospiraceae bacterium]|nr:TNT domain-containing protein [Lachnospiraceae bacterium]
MELVGNLINIFGEELPAEADKLSIVRKPEYLDGNNQLKFGKEYSKDADSNGFDIKYKIKKKKLVAGEVYVRFGVEKGAYLTAPHTPYEKLSMPYILETVPFHVYQVNPKYKKRPRYVYEGITAIDFEQPGGGIQYYIKSSSVQLLIQDEVLIEISPEEYLINKETYN